MSQKNVRTKIIIEMYSYFHGYRRKPKVLDPEDKRSEPIVSTKIVNSCPVILSIIVRSLDQ